MKKHDIVVDDLGYHYAVDSVNDEDETATIHSVIDKMIYINVPQSELEVVEGLREA